MPPDESTETTEETTTDETTEETTEETSSEEETEETSETSETTETDKDELKVSKQDFALIQLLKDPRTRKQALSAIAESAGVKIATGEETKAAAKKSAQELLHEALGADWAFLAPKLAPALNQLVEDKLSDLKSEFATEKQRQVLRESENATARMYKRFPDFKNYEAEVLKAMDKFQPSEDMSPGDFIESLYFMVKGRKGQNTLAKETAKRIARNSRDAELTGGGVTDEGKLKAGSKRPTLDEAVKRAIAQVQKEK